MDRDIKIDILKCLGAILIVLAHTCNSNIIFQIRNFDVPLMVLISGYLSIKSFKREESIVKYYKKRITRLIVPTYIFFIIFFAIVKLLNIGQPYPFDIRTIMRTFLLLEGVGYVWIIRVYALCTIVTPGIIYITDKFQKKVDLIFIVLLYCTYEIIYYYCGDLNIFFKYIFNYLIPYSMVLYIGMKMYKSSNKKNNALILIFSGIFIVLLAVNYYKYGYFIGTQAMKYPPRLYYLSYALMIACMLLRILKNEKIARLIHNQFIMFVSKNSLWIYLWHILYVYILEKYEIHYILKFLTVLLMTLITVFIQQKIITFLESKNVNKSVLKVFKG